MDVSSIMAIIGNVGFPIACCLCMFYYTNKQEERHKQEVDKLTQAVDNNTLALTKLLERLGVHTDVK